MTGLVFLGAAIVCELVATLTLKAASLGRHRLYAVVVAGYVAAFTMLALALAEGLGLGVAYGTWTAAGVATTAIAARFLYGEPLNRTMGLGIALIGAGVMLVQAGLAS
ncbi:DMT family transporter [Pimelobacter simplex]|uniref:DMT family transporter n=1 Tax=Nocardioides simplex TaxID=2045 RepID=UPI0019346458|nr:QacE family quaternary ammonium compound efflux SMR transporter [Pimelobacter simplex]